MCLCFPPPLVPAKKFRGTSDVSFALGSPDGCIFARTGELFWLASRGRTHERVVLRFGEYSSNPLDDLTTPRRLCRYKVPRGAATGGFSKGSCWEYYGGIYASRRYFVGSWSANEIYKVLTSCPASATLSHGRTCRWLTDPGVVYLL